MRIELVILFHACITICDTCAIAYFYKVFLGENCRGKALYYLAYGFYAAANVLLTVFLSSILLRTIFNLGFPFLLAYFFYRETRWKRIFTGALGMSFQIIPEPLVAVLASYLTGYIFREIAVNDIMYFVCACLATAFFLLSIRAVTFRRKKQTAAISSRRYGLLLLFAAICIFMAYAELITILRSEAALTLTHVLLEFCICAMPALIFYVFERFQEHAFEQAKTKVLHAQIELMESHQLEVIRLKHDFNGQLAIMREMALRGNNSELLKYIESYDADVSQILDNAITGFTSIDALIASKKREAAKRGVVFEVCAAPMAKLSVSPVHLNNILVNALDNSLEACDTLGVSAVRHIELTLKTEDEHLFIKVINSSAPVNKGSGDFPATTKEDRANHGVGMESIRESVEKYRGIMNFEYRSGEFILLIRLSNSEV
ncbi:MAG: GHKL domain-containing protein [Oscillospiraceae bacterium]|nr:GHKL domain-containing protein [Oscillospiraceae bacterium]